MVLFGVGGGTSLFADAPPAYRLFDLLDSGLLGLLGGLGLVALLHLPFPTRRGPPAGPRTGRWLERLGRLGNLLLPGTLWLTRGRLVAGMLGMALAPVLAMLARLGSEGGLLMAIALPNLPSPFGEVGLSELLVTPQMALVGDVARVLAVLLYLGAWGEALTSLVRSRSGGEADATAVVEGARAEG